MGHSVHSLLAAMAGEAGWASWFSDCKVLVWKSGPGWLQGLGWLQGWAASSALPRMVGWLGLIMALNPILLEKLGLGFCLAATKPGCLSFLLLAAECFQASNHDISNCQALLPADQLAGINRQLPPIKPSISQPIQAHKPSQAGMLKGCMELECLRLALMLLDGKGGMPAWKFGALDGKG